MKVSYNWLKEYAAFDKSPEEIAKILTDTGLEVEGLHKIESIKGGLKGVVIGEVVSCEKHPNADRLKVTKVNDGNGELQIVCGAPNVAKGQKVVVATVGTTLYPNPDESFKIKKSNIRGVESEGMLCAEDELGLGESHDGILVVDSSIEVGIPAANYFQLEDDYEIEIGLTPNRADAMSHIGVVRDIIAYLNVHENAGLKLNMPDISNYKVDSNNLKIDVSVEDKEAAPRYMGTTISGVKIGPSPAWIQNRLRSIGLSPINNVVDITNYVMHELGTPLHAFSADKLNGKIVVKTAKDKAKFKTLDEIERELDGSNLMITNGEENLCIAGVFGGIDSGVKDSTTEVFLESAVFNPVSVRKTAKMHGLNTDASFRFERGVDPNMTDFALKRAAALIKDVAGGKIAMDAVDIYDHPIESITVSFDYDECNRLIGNELSRDLINNILENLDFQLGKINGSIVEVQVPVYRNDVTRQADIVEEVLRIYGYNKVSLPKKLTSSIGHFSKPDPEKVQTTVSEMLVGLGCYETLNNSLTKSKYSASIGGEVVREDNNVHILNPLSQDLDVMRQTLLFNCLETIEHNQNRQHPDLKIFEFGKVYHKYESGYNENRRLLIALTGKKEEENWNSRKDQVSFYTIKGIVSGVFNRLGLESFMKEKGLRKSLLQDGVEVHILKSKVGEIGWVPKNILKQFGIKNDVFIADLDWDALMDSLKLASIKFKELPKTFAVRRDFSLLIDQKVRFSQIIDTSKKCDNKLLSDIGLFDVYEGEKLKAGTKSYAVSFMFQDNEKTLKDAQVDAIMVKIRSALENELGAELR